MPTDLGLESLSLSMQVCIHNLDQAIWLVKIRSGCGILIYSAWQGLIILQLNLNDSNTDAAFTVANSNSFLSAYEILPTAQENKYLWLF